MGASFGHKNKYISVSAVPTEKHQHVVSTAALSFASDVHRCVKDVVTSSKERVNILFFQSEVKCKILFCVN